MYMQRRGDGDIPRDPTADGPKRRPAPGDREAVAESIPVMTRLRVHEREVLDLLIEGGIARSRSEALAWCVRLVVQHEGEWLEELRIASIHVAEVRRRGPAC